MDKLTPTPLFVVRISIEEQLNQAKSNYIKKCYLDAHSLFEKAALRGSPEAHYFLGIMYTEGQGVEKDISVAVTWACDAAILGNLTAIKNMQSDEFADHRAALIDNIDSYSMSKQYQIGLLFHNMEGPEDHDQIAFEFFKRSAAQGDEKAQYIRGWMYFNSFIIGPQPLSEFNTVQHVVYVASLGSKQARKQLLSLVNNENFKYEGEITLPENNVRMVLQGSFILNGAKFEILGQGTYGIVIRECADDTYCLKLEHRMDYENENINCLLSLIRGPTSDSPSDEYINFAKPHRTVRIFNEINRKLIDDEVVEKAQVVDFCGSEVVRLPLLIPVTTENSDEAGQAYAAMALICLQIYMDSGRIIPDIIGINNAMWSRKTRSRELVFNDISSSYSQRRGSFSGMFETASTINNIPNNIFNDYANYWKVFADEHPLKDTVIKILIGLIVYDYSQSLVEQAKKEPVTQAPSHDFDLGEVALEHYESLFNDICNSPAPSGESHLDSGVRGKLRELMHKLNPDAPCFTEPEEETVFVTQNIKTSP